MPGQERIPGCANESFGRCLVKGEQPSLAYTGNFIPVGEIEGPGLTTEPGLGCSVSSDPTQQENCDKYESRTTAHDERDANL